MNAKKLDIILKVFLLFFVGYALAGFLITSGGHSLVFRKGLFFFGSIGYFINSVKMRVERRKSMMYAYIVLAVLCILYAVYVL